MSRNRVFHPLTPADRSAIQPANHAKDDVVFTAKLDGDKVVVEAADALGNIHRVEREDGDMLAAVLEASDAAKAVKPAKLKPTKPVQPLA